MDGGSLVEQSSQAPSFSALLLVPGFHLRMRFPLHRTFDNQMERTKLIAFLEEQGYYSLREVEGRGLCGLMKFIFTTGLVLGLDEHSYRGRYCYSSAADAQSALDSWDSQGDPGGPWIKYKGEGGERSNLSCDACKAAQKVQEVSA